MSSKIFELEQEPEKTVEWNAKRLVYQRKNNRLTPKQLAEAMGVSVNQIICMENCTRIPSDEMLDTLASFFDVPLDYFGTETSDGRLIIKPPDENNPIKLSLQDERQQAAKETLKKQRRYLREMMKAAKFPLNCTGLNCLAEAINETVSETCKFVNGDLKMPVETVRKTKAWYATIQKGAE